MKKSFMQPIQIITSFIFLLFFNFSFICCDNGFENTNTPSDKTSKLNVVNKLTSTELYISGDRYECWRANLIYCSTMIQHLASTAGYWAGDKYTYDKDYSSSLIDTNYKNAVKTIIDMQDQLIKENAPEEMKAIVRILRVFVFQRLTDLYGDLPYKEAGKAFTEKIQRPKYDKQSDIYADMLKELDESAPALTPGQSGFGEGDIIFKGDKTKWKKFAYSLMLRLALRMIKVAPADAQKWASTAINGGVMQSNEDIAYIQHTAGPEGINANGNGQVFTVDNYPRMSKTFIDFLKNNDDPRLPILSSRKSDGSTKSDNLKGLPNGLDAALLKKSTKEDDTDSYAEPNRMITGEDDSMFFQTYAEVEFMLAESAVHWGLAGGNAQTHYDKGVRAAMKMLQKYDPAAKISDVQIDNYLTAHPFDSSTALEQINTQYWAATFLNEYESFANWRRTDIPHLIPVNYPKNVTNGTIPRRLRYPESEISNNPENYHEAIKHQGEDKLTTRVWWDKL